MPDGVLPAELRGFLEDGDGYRLDPQSDGLLHAISLLTDHYRTHLIPITNLIHAKPRRIQQFADAFKLKKDWAVFGSHVEAQRQAA
jgi:hypothetical protein